MGSQDGLTGQAQTAGSHSKLSPLAGLRGHVPATYLLKTRKEKIRGQYSGAPIRCHQSRVLLQWDVLEAQAIEFEMFHTGEAIQIKGTVERTSASQGLCNLGYHPSLSPATPGCLLPGAAPTRSPRFSF